jgi:hypothetical protein
MVLFQTEEAGHFAIGKITAVGGDALQLAGADVGCGAEAEGAEAMLTVHEYEPRKGVGATFLPLWIKGKRRERKADKPVGFTAEEVEVGGGCCEKAGLLRRVGWQLEVDGGIRQLCADADSHLGLHIFPL